MKTLDEVIKAIENCLNPADKLGNCRDECPYIHCCDPMGISVKNDVLHYLKEYQDAKNTLDIEREKTIEAYCQWKDAKEKLEAQTSQKMWVDNHFQFEISDNPPLTWDELKEMKGKPIWVEYAADEQQTGWFLIAKNPERPTFGKSKIFTLVREDGRFYLTISGYGKTWKAYRREKK